MLPGGSRTTAPPGPSGTPAVVRSPAAPQATAEPAPTTTANTTATLNEVASNASKSYATVADPNVGARLSYVPVQTINGSKCATISRDDIEPELHYWQSAVLCTVLGAYPPFEIVQRYIRRLWAELSVDKIILVRKGVFLVRFDCMEDKDKALARGIYFFNRKPFIVQSWNTDLDMTTASITTLPLWIQLPGLEIKYWGISSLNKLCSILGKPIRTDQYTQEKTMWRYARVLIEMPMTGPFPDHIDFFNEEGILVRQEVHYEWLPIKCDHCHMLGHETDTCRKKPTVLQVWRPVQPQPARPVAERTTEDQTASPAHSDATGNTSTPLGADAAALMAPEATARTSAHPAETTPDARPVEVPLPTPPQNSPVITTVDDTDKEGFTPVRRKKAARPQTRSQAHAQQNSTKASPHLRGQPPHGQHR